LRPGLATLTTILALCWTDRDGSRDYLIAPSLGVIFAYLLAGTAQSTGQGLIMAIVFGMCTFWSMVIATPFASAIARANDDVQRGLLPPLMVILCSLQNLSLPGIAAGAMFVLLTDAIVFDDTWPDEFPMQLSVTIFVGVAFVPAIHALPLPWMSSEGAFSLRPSSDALTALEQVKRARSLAAALVRHLADCASTSEQSIAPAQHLEQRLREVVGQLKKLQPTACMELALVCRKGTAAYIATWVGRLDRQVKYLSLLAHITSIGSGVLASSPIARNGIERNRALLVAVADAILADTADGSMPSLKSEVAALLEAHARARAELFRSILAEQGAADEPAGAGRRYQIARASLFTQVFLHALLALCAAADDANVADGGGEAASPIWNLFQVAPPTAPQPSKLAKLRQIFGPPPFDCTSCGVRRALVLGVSMGIATLWCTEPDLIDSANGHGSWIGITIGAIHVADADNTLAKSFNRIWGTLLAAAFGLFLINSTAIDYDGAWIPLVCLWVVACHFWRHLLAETSLYLVQVASFTALVFLITPSSQGPNLTTLTETSVVMRITMVVYGVIIYSIVQYAFFPVSSRAQFEAEVKRFLPLASKCLEAAKAVLPESDEKLPPSAVAPLQQASAALHKSLAVASERYTTAAHAPYFGICPPFPAKPFGELVAAQAEAGLMLDVLSANVAHVTRLVHSENNPDSRKAVLKLVHTVLSPVIAHVATCMSSQDVLVASLTSGWDTPAGPSPYTSRCSASSASSRCVTRWWRYIWRCLARRSRSRSSRPGSSAGTSSALSR